MSKSSSKIPLSFWVLLIIIGVWIAAYPVAKNLPKDAFTDPVSALYEGLNVLFTALAFGGVIITLFFQLEEARIARREALERSIFELFQIFTAPDFQPVKDAAFRVLLASVKDKNYADYVASRLFVVEQLPFPAASAATLIKLDDQKSQMDGEALVHADRADRLMLDNVLNFFAMLAQRETSKDVIKHCDFAYDWWRPVLWIIGQLQLERYEASPQIRKYCKNQLVVETLKALDKIYEHTEPAEPEQIWQYIIDHPKLQSFQIDPAFNSKLRLPV